MTNSRSDSIASEGTLVQATRLVMNCLPPEGTPHPPRTAFEINCPKSLKAKIKANWLSDGFPEVYR